MSDPAPSAHRLSISGEELRRMLGVAAFGLSVHSAPLLSVGSALVGILLLVSTIPGGRNRGLMSSRAVVVVAAAGSVLAGLSTGVITFPSPSRQFPSVIVVAMVVMMLVYLRADLLDQRVVVVTSTVLLLGVAAATVILHSGEDVGFDAYLAHEAASEAVLANINPYSEDVRFPDGSPSAAPGAVLEGYAYPPATLAAFVLGDLVAGDPRWAAVFALGGALAFMILRGREDLLVLSGVLLVLAAMPLHRAIIWSGWTEPVTLVALLAGAILWRRPILCGVLLGIALGSKQYLVALVPLLAGAEQKPRARTVVAMSVAAVTLIPSALVDFNRFWFTMVERPLSLGFRSDTTSISGALADLGVAFEIPFLAAFGAVVAIGYFLGRRVATVSDLLAAAAVVLGSLFWLTLAFPNYWWLVQWLTAASAVWGKRMLWDQEVAPTLTRDGAGPSA